MNDQSESDPPGAATPGSNPKERTRMGRDIVALLPRLRRFAAGLSGSVQEGDDIVQAACLRALERHYQWEPGTRLDSWMFRIIRNLWLDGRKSAWNRLVHSDDAAMTAAPGGSLEHEIEARNELALARKAIAALPPQQREVLMLVTVEGHSYEAAADTLGIPLGTVMSRLARARVAVARSVRESNAAAPAGKAARGG
jgi:RNA polymerase sigma-70 factor (ECF subfamily)